jgi:hypothetical protein
MKFVGSSKNMISGDNISTLASAIFVLCHQLTSDSFDLSKFVIHSHDATRFIIPL